MHNYDADKVDAFGAMLFAPTWGTVFVPIRWQAGDRLWVRETWARNHDMPAGTPWGAVYKVDPGHDYDVPKWTPSIHMPRWASRIALEVTNVRVERLQDITEADALAEGIESTEFWRDEHPPSICYSVLWNAINGPNAWHANPWVSATTFRRVEQSHG